MRADYIVNGYSTVHLTCLPRTKLADNKVRTRFLGYDVATGVACISFLGRIRFDVLILFENGWGGGCGV
jgi:hypothetical protein